MKYMGSKARFAKEILEIVLADRNDRVYIEPFCGGMNSIDKVNGQRVANDSNLYLMSMWEALIYKDFKPEKITKEFYKEVQQNKHKYEPYLVGWIGFNCSYIGKFFGGFAGEVNTKGGFRDYQSEAIKNVSKQVENLKGVTLSNESYFDLDIPEDSIIYCDPPYAGTTKYSGEFDHDLFWQWVRDQSKDNIVYVSEYAAPDDFECVWSKEAKSSLSANGKIGGNKVSIEKLFKLKDD